MPNGSLLKKYLPNRVTKVVSGWEFLDKEICQNPLFASSLLKYFAPASCANISSTLGIG